MHVCAQFNLARSLNTTRMTNCSANVDAQMDLQQQAVYQAKSGSLNFACAILLLVLVTPKTQAAQAMGNIGPSTIWQAASVHALLEDPKSLHSVQPQN